jgi:hypothetical protein
MASSRRLVGSAAVLAAALAAAGAAVAGGYDYGRGSSYGGGEAGMVVLVEGLVANPRNADNVVATIDSGGTLFPIVPSWDDDAAGRIGVGYRLASGDEVRLTAWGFQTRVDAAGSGAFELPIGPASGSAYAVETEIKARTIDVSWSVPQEAGELFGIVWSVGARWAGFEETTAGQYTIGGAAHQAYKSNQGSMIGGRLAGRASYRRGPFEVGTGLGLSLLSGDLEASAALTPATPTSVNTGQTDDGRSGTILDFEVTAGWHSSNDAIRIWAGWEQAVWEDIATDLLRNLPGAVAPLRERDAVTFSGFKIGAEFRF